MRHITSPNTEFPTSYSNQSINWNEWFNIDEMNLCLVHMCEWFNTKEGCDVKILYFICFFDDYFSSPSCLWLNQRKKVSFIKVDEIVDFSRENKKLINALEHTIQHVQNSQSIFLKSLLFYITSQGCSQGRIDPTLRLKFVWKILGPY